MPAIPLPFVITLLLAIALVRLALRPDGPGNPFFLAMIAAYALQSAVIGLHWAYGLVLAPLQSTLAAALPPLTWLSFDSLRPPGRHRHRAWFHATAPALVGLLWLVRADGVDVDLVLGAIWLGYALALIALARSGPDALTLARIDGALTAHRALLAAAAALIGSAAVDAAIALDFSLAQGSHAPRIVAILAGTAALAGRALPTAPPEPQPPLP
jgi:hypothetical protein